MRKIPLLLTVLLVPLIISGCFGLGKDKPEEETNYLVYENLTLSDASYSVRHPEAWKVTEASTGQLGTSTDEVIFKVDRSLIISILTFKDIDSETVLAGYEIESQTQTEVNRLLGDRVIGLNKEQSIQEEAILVLNGDYLYILKTDLPHSPEFTDFLNKVTIFNNLNVIDDTVNEENRPVYKIYFGRTANQGECNVSYYRKVYLSLVEEDLALIPVAMKGLLSPQQLKLDELGLFTAIPEGTKLLSFGYDNNKAIVNFNYRLNQGGGSCEMTMRRSQIERTLKALNEVSDLNIQQVEIQVEGQVEGVLQP